MARRLQEQLSERSGLFQYYDLSNLEPEENNPDHEDNHNPNLRSQPEEEPNRRISSDLQNQEQERLRAQENLRETMENTSSRLSHGIIIRDTSSRISYRHTICRGEFNE